MDRDLTSDEEWRKLAKAIREARDKKRKREYQQAKRLRKEQEKTNE